MNFEDRLRLQLGGMLLQIMQLQMEKEQLESKLTEAGKVVRLVKKEPDQK